ncbi:MAG: hypothetical protein UU57_C0038G0003 [Candidatus Woesebacteria bacterium GW2011_GWE1_41_24]|uniref:DUF4342 domain-containing protein n=1 Tax=Candidatus Woesebacteria bacterium GW2011_GWE1_41_24 TaxID=1618597 RepID=A0A0G0VTQ0_9BACT|nr:MAG: hypothetical protein UU57_C0038G0003 [Candidatus Woesebacteria bacterium GW2011_GWE1_41_24]
MTDQINNSDETFKVNGEDLLKKVKELINEGNIREIKILDKTGNTIVIIPLTVGVIGALLIPVLAIVGTIAALVTECTIVVKRKTN